MYVKVFSIIRFDKVSSEMYEYTHLYLCIIMYVLRQDRLIVSGPKAGERVIYERSVNNVITSVSAWFCFDVMLFRLGVKCDQVISVREYFRISPSLSPARLIISAYRHVTKTCLRE